MVPPRHGVPPPQFPADLLTHTVQSCVRGLRICVRRGPTGYAQTFSCRWISAPDPPSSTGALSPCVLSVHIVTWKSRSCTRDESLLLAFCEARSWSRGDRTGRGSRPSPGGANAVARAEHASDLLFPRGLEAALAREQPLLPRAAVPSGQPQVIWGHSFLIFLSKFKSVFPAFYLSHMSDYNQWPSVSHAYLASPTRCV